jgi:hypothetical protein
VAAGRFGCQRGRDVSGILTCNYVMKLVGLCPCHEGVWGSGDTAASILTLALDEDECLLQWMGPVAPVDALERRKIT